MISKMVGNNRTALLAMLSLWIIVCVAAFYTYTKIEFLFYKAAGEGIRHGRDTILIQIYIR